ncbi:MAG: YraN family protein [Spirochaetaceae bacterium]|nr:YraN family protein [Spirochaetaceae bacterium]
MTSSHKGLEGENKASRYLEDNGYEILERRFRSGPGEVDIIVRKGDVVVFVEVKTWDILGVESLERSIDSRKRGKIRKVASLFLLRHPELGGCRIRFDLIFLSRRMGKLDHWEHAF